MRRTVLLLTTMALTLLVASGIAVAESQLDQQQTLTDGGFAVVDQPPNTAETDQAQTYTSGKSGVADKVSLYVGCCVDGSGNFEGTPPPVGLMVLIRAVDNSTGFPDGNLISIGSIPAASFSTDGSLGWVDVPLNPLSGSHGLVKAGEQYAIYLEVDSCYTVDGAWCQPLSESSYQWGRTTPSAYDGGGALTYSNGTWQAQDQYDFAFKTFVSADTTSPTVQSVNPSDGATQVVRDTNVTAKFSEDVDGATLTPDTFMLGKGKLSSSQLTSSTKIGSGTTVGYDPTIQTATLYPYGSSAAKLARCRWYTAKVSSGVKDKAGNPALEKVWSFKTRGC